MHGQLGDGEVPSRPPMRIVLLTQYYRPEVGAAQVRLQAITRELVRLGHQVDVVTAMPNYPTGRIFDGYRRRVAMTEQLDGATIRRVWAYPATGTGIGRMFGYLTFSFLSMFAVLRSRRPDVVIVESPPLVTVVPALVNRWLRGTPYLLITADLWPDVAVDMGLLDPGPILSVMTWLERIAYRDAWRITPVTERQIETLRDEKHVPLDKLVMLPNGVDPDLFGPGPPSASATEILGRDHRIVLYAGTHGHAHGMDIILDIAPALARRCPDVMIVCVGGGSERDRLIGRATGEHIDNVRFLEARPIEEIADLYRASWAGLSTLRPSKSLEAARPSKVFPIMASALPVIYSGDGEGADLVRTAGAGIVCAGGDRDALLNAIEQLDDDPEAAKDMGRRGRDYVRAHLAWPHIVSEWVDRLGSPAR